MLTKDVSCDVFVVVSWTKMEKQKTQKGLRALIYFGDVSVGVRYFRVSKNTVNIFLSFTVFIIWTFLLIRGLKEAKEVF